MRRSSSTATRRWRKSGRTRSSPTAGSYHHGRNNRNGTTRQLRKGLRKIQAYLPEWDGIETGEIEREVRKRLEGVESGGSFGRYPRIGQTRPWPGLRSPLKK